MELTKFLNLLKKDPVADAADTFNIKTMLNDNWDKLDAFAEKLSEDMENTIQTGSYVGTGTCGAANPNSLTFDKPPKILAICNSYGVPIFDQTTTVSQKYVGMTDVLTTEYQDDKWAELSGSTEAYLFISCRAKCSEDRKTISWYADGFEEGQSNQAAYAQCNSSGTTYHYFAFF